VEINNPQPCQPTGKPAIRNPLAGSAGLSTNTLPREVIEGLRRLLAPASVIVCTGNELCGDDAAGLWVARKIDAAVPWKVYDVGSAPENFLFTIAQSRPEAVLVIDAMDFGGRPGEVALVGADRIEGQGPCTHGPAPEAFLELLAQLHPCPAAVLGIQPAGVVVGAPLSAAATASVEAVASTLQLLGARLASRGGGEVRASE